MIPNQVVDINSDWKYTFTGLLKYVNYTATDKQECKYKVVELGTLRSSDELGSTIPDPQVRSYKANNRILSRIYYREQWQLQYYK